MYRYPDSDDILTSAYVAAQEPYPAYWQQSESRVLSIADKFLTRTRASTLLDVGCGTGRLFDRLASYASTLFALEPDPQRLERAHNHAMHISKRVTIHFIPETFLDATLLPASFDIIVCSHVIQHIHPAAVEPFFNKMHSLLTERAFLLLLTTHSTSGTDIYSTTERVGSEVRNTPVSRRTFDGTISEPHGTEIVPVRHFSISKLRDYLINYTIIAERVYHLMHPYNIIDRLMFRDSIANLPYIKHRFGTDVMLLARRL